MMRERKGRLATLYMRGGQGEEEEEEEEESGGGGHTMSRR
jgi:hypothetical protein